MRTLFSAVGVAVFLVTVNSHGQTPSASTSCLHGATEPPSEAARRREALRHVRAINTAEAAAGTPYRPLEALGIAPLVGGWDVRLVVEPDHYTIALLDVADPCGFGWFSDERGLIWEAKALQ